MRAFLAIEIDPKLKEKIENIGKDLLKIGLDAKITPKPKLHCTVKFLGDISQEQCDKIRQSIQFVSQIKGFEMKINGVAAFLNQDKPNIIWAGVESVELKDLMKKVDNELSTIKREFKPSIPHITLLRCKQSRNMDLLQKTLEDLKGMFIGTQEVNSINLLRSTPTAEGHVYEKIWSLELKQ